jgi:hypothetical protein
MGYSDIFKQKPEAHVDTPAQAAARTAATADVKAKADAKAAKAATAAGAKGAPATVAEPEKK